MGKRKATTVEESRAREAGPHKSITIWERMARYRKRCKKCLASMDIVAVDGERLERRYRFPREMPLISIVKEGRAVDAWNKLCQMEEALAGGDWERIANVAFSLGTSEEFLLRPDNVIDSFYLNTARSQLRFLPVAKGGTKTAKGGRKKDSKATRNEKAMKYQNALIREMVGDNTHKLSWMESTDLVAKQLRTTGKTVREWLKKIGVTSDNWRNLLEKNRS